ncbi:MAG: hypothetical protein ACOCQ4_02205 [bacterium]
MTNEEKCKWCGKTFDKASLISIKSAVQGERRNYCSNKCYNEAMAAKGEGGGGGSSSNNSSSDAAIEAQEEARIEARVDSISKISFGSDINQVQEVLNQLTTIGATKPDKDVRKAIVEKMEFGIMKLKNAGMNSEAEFFEDKMKKIKPKWYE